MAFRTKALRDFCKFKRTHGLSGIAIAKAIGVSKGAVSGWLSGTLLPDFKNRLAIEKWTGGAVQPADWLTEQDRAELERVRPYEAPAPAVAA